MPGARHSKSDKELINGSRQMLRQIDENLVNLGADEEQETPEGEQPEAEPEMMDAEKTMVWFGDPVKALDGGKVAGYLVRFSTAKDPDLTGEYFTADTDFGDASSSPVLYHHGMDTKVGKRQLGRGDIRKDDVGVWIEAQLEMRDEYEKAIYEMAKGGKLGWSSGTAGHLVERSGSKITRWPLGLDASLTPTPAEPRNEAVLLKSLLPGMGLQSATTQPDDEPIIEPVKMEIKTMTESMSITQDELKAMMTEAAKTGAEEFAKSLPASSYASVSVTQDPADNKFTSMAEQCRAIKAYTQSMGRNADPRLARLEVKATGASESVGSDGGFLLEPTLTSEILKPLHEEGPFTSLVRRLPVSGNSNYGWINGVDETSRATGSRWGGIRGYRIAEAEAPTASRPKFKRINWELKKYGVLVYGTDELLADASMFSTIVREGAAEELMFMANDDIVNGAGTGGPTGFLNSGALVSVAKETGQAAATITNTNLLSMWSRMHARSKQAAKWFYNTDCGPQLHQLALPVGAAALEPRFVAYSPDGSLTIFGKPAVETEFNATLGTVGDIVCADMSQYLYWEKQGVQEASSIHVAFAADETVFRFIYRVDGQTAMASALTPYTGTSNTVSSFVALATRA